MYSAITFPNALSYRSEYTDTSNFTCANEITLLTDVNSILGVV